MARTLVKRTAWTLLIALLVLVAVLASAEPFWAEQPGKAPPYRPYKAEIVRDEFGVPHIHGKTDADTAFGVAWAHSEHDFCTLQDVVAMTRNGVLAKLRSPSSATSPLDANCPLRRT